LTSEAPWRSVIPSGTTSASEGKRSPRKGRASPDRPRWGEVTDSTAEESLEVDDPHDEARGLELETEPDAALRR
jgi:hypothetical protein